MPEDINLIEGADASGGNVELRGSGPRKVYTRVVVENRVAGAGFSQGNVYFDGERVTYNDFHVRYDFTFGVVELNLLVSHHLSTKRRSFDSVGLLSHLSSYSSGYAEKIGPSHNRVNIKAFASSAVKSILSSPAISNCPVLAFAAGKASYYGLSSSQVDLTSEAFSFKSARDATNLAVKVVADAFSAYKARKGTLEQSVVVYGAASQKKITSSSAQPIDVDVSNPLRLDNMRLSSVEETVVSEVFDVRGAPNKRNKTVLSVTSLAEDLSHYLHKSSYALTKVKVRYAVSRINHFMGMCSTGVAVTPLDLGTYKSKQDYVDMKLDIDPYMLGGSHKNDQIGLLVSHLSAADMHASRSDYLTTSVLAASKLINRKNTSDQASVQSVLSWVEERPNGIKNAVNALMLDIAVSGPSSVASFKGVNYDISSLLLVSASSLTSRFSFGDPEVHIAVDPLFANQKATSGISSAQEVRVYRATSEQKDARSSISLTNNILESADYSIVKYGAPSLVVPVHEAVAHYTHRLDGTFGQVNAEIGSYGKSNRVFDAPVLAVGLSALMGGYKARNQDISIGLDVSYLLSAYKLAFGASQNRILIDMFSRGGEIDKILDWMRGFNGVSISRRSALPSNISIERIERPVVSSNNSDLVQLHRFRTAAVVSAERLRPKHSGDIYVEVER